MESRMILSSPVSSCSGLLAASRWRAVLVVAYHENSILKDHLWSPLGRRSTLKSGFTRMPVTGRSHLDGSSMSISMV